MSSFSHLLDGFSLALTWQNLLYCLAGCFWGTVVGVLPGLGPLAGMTLLLPLTYSLDPAGAMIMLAGIFYGAMYGGSITSILVRIPGEAASVITCIDGYQMARQGRAGPALVITALGSFIGGTLSIFGLILFAPILGEAMLKVGAAAELMLMLLALVAMTFVSPGRPVKVIAMLSIGLVIATVGFDPLTGWPRFTFGRLDLTEGLSFVALAIGLFGVSEILLSLESMARVSPISPRLRDLIPVRADLRSSAPAIARGSLIGFLFGVIPGISHVVSTFVSYAVEKRLSKTPELFGKGAIAGVAGPETANNATTGSAMIPLLTLGIPAIPSTAVLLSALMIHGIRPGPQLVVDHPDVFWGLIASMYIGNVILLILNIPLVGLFVALLRLPYAYLAPTILLISVVGVYSVTASILDVWVMIGAGLAGYVLRKFEFDPAPLVIAVVLGDRIEVNFRRALAISDGDYSIFLRGTAVQVLLVAGALLVMLQAMAWALGYRKSTISDIEDDSKP